MSRALCPDCERRVTNACADCSPEARIAIRSARAKAARAKRANPEFDYAQKHASPDG